HSLDDASVPATDGALLTAVPPQDVPVDEYCLQFRRRPHPHLTLDPIPRHAQRTPPFGLGLDVDCRVPGELACRSPHHALAHDRTSSTLHRPPHPGAQTNQA